MSKKIALILVLFLIGNVLCAQPSQRSKEISVSLLNNGIAIPFSGKAGVIHSPIHPGFTIGYTRSANRSRLHQFTLTYKFGYVFQHRVQHAIQLYPEIGYRLQTRIGIGLNAAFGLGYMHSFPDHEQFKLNSKGEYERYGRAGRPSAFGSFTLGLGYDLEKISKLPLYPFINYQIWMQSPYVRSYVPVLPNAALHIGAVYKLTKSSL